MSYLKPARAEVYLIYECPACNCEWQKLPKEVRLLKGFVCEGCGAFNRYEPIANVRVVLEKQTQVKPKKPTVTKNELTQLQQDAILALKALGFPMKESKLFVEQHSFQTIEDYIPGAVRIGTSND